MSAQAPVRPGRRSASPALFTGMVIAGTGAWAFLHPWSFYDLVATYPPFNRHLFHDAGAFLMGLGAALIVATRMRSAMGVAVVANAVAAVMHFVSHVVDRSLGGRASDPYLLGAVALLFVWPLVKRVRS